MSLKLEQEFELVKAASNLEKVTDRSALERLCIEAQNCAKGYYIYVANYCKGVFVVSPFFAMGTDELIQISTENLRLAILSLLADSYTCQNVFSDLVKQEFTK